MPHDIRDSVVDFVRNLATRTELPAQRILGWLDLASGKFYRWRDRYGRINRHNSWVPRDQWITHAERESIIGYHDAHPLEGYRRLAFMMLDEDVVAVSPSLQVCDPARPDLRGKRSRSGVLPSDPRFSYK